MFVVFDLEEKKRVRMGVLALGKVSLSVYLIEILSKTTERLSGISPVARQADFIFWKVIPCSRSLLY